MRLTLILAAVIAALSAAQTPLEFGIVQDMVGGDPPISVYSIKTVNEDGSTVLQIAARAGVQFNCTRHSMLADTSYAGTVFIQGQVSYTASLMSPVIERFFSVIRNRMDIHGSGGISVLKVDLITPDEMGWLAVTVPLSRVDSLLQGSMTPIDFWSATPVREIEVGTMGHPVVNESPLPELHGSPAYPLEVIEETSGGENCAWKSLILPGWGQISCGEGLPAANIIAEIAGAVLLFTDDYTEAGIGILAVNHLVSFADLL